MIVNIRTLERQWTMVLNDSVLKRDWENHLINELRLLQMENFRDEFTESTALSKTKPST
jgi:hypothetical protein